MHITCNNENARFAHNEMKTQGFVAKEWMKAWWFSFEDNFEVSSTVNVNMILGDSTSQTDELIVHPEFHDND